MANLGLNMAELGLNMADKEVCVFDGERIDDTGFGNLKLIQKPEEFCYGVDAVILADFAAKWVSPANRRNGENVTAVDLGTGTGIIPLILSHKTPWKELIGVEIQKDSFDRAVRNARLNNLEDRLRFINGDVKDFGSANATGGTNATGGASGASAVGGSWGASAVGGSWGEELKGCVDVVTSNPPYTAGTGGLKSSNDAKAIARHEITAGLEEFIRCGAALLKPRGDFFMVHRPSRLVDICCFGRKYGVEPKEMCFVSPNMEAAPNIILVHMVKGGGKQLKILDPLFVYKMDNTYTEKLRECYK